MKNKIKKFSVVFSALILSVVSLSSIVLPQIAHATGGTGTYYEWTGAASGTAGLNGCTSNCWSVPGNWKVSTDGGTTYAVATTAPNSTDNSNSGDYLVFDFTNLTSSENLTNDISNLIVNQMDFTGSNTNYYSYAIGGNSFSLGYGMQGGQGFETLFLNTTIDLLASQTFNNINIFGHNSNGPYGSINVASYNLQLVNANSVTGFSGSGTITVSGTPNSGSSSVNPNDVFNSITANPNFSGKIVDTVSYSLIYIGIDGLGTGSIDMSGATGSTLDLYGFNGAVFPNNVTFGSNDTLEAEALSGGAPSSSNPQDDVTLSGSITLASSDLTVNTDGVMTITGAISGSYAITPTAGMFGSLVINSSSNGSTTSNGTSTAAAQTITVASGDNQPGTYVNVGKNQTEIIDGIRGDVIVSSGGILKGNGVLGSISEYPGGIVAPGHSPGCLTTTDASGLALNGTYQVYIDGTTACSQYSSIIVQQGLVNLSAGGVPGEVVTATSPGTLAVSFLNGFVPKVGESFEIINNQANKAVVGTFANMPEGSTFVANGVTFKITYKGGNGNSVVLTVMNYPGYVAPKTPDTGFGLISNNSSTSTIILTAVASVSLIFIARYYTKSTSKK